MASASCPNCGAARAPGPICLSCGLVFDADLASPVPPVPLESRSVVVRAYPAQSQDEASSAFRAEASRLAAEGYLAVGQAWVPGDRRTRRADVSLAVGLVMLFLFLAFGCMASESFQLPVEWYLLALFATIFLAFGVTAKKTDGTLTVTFERR
jgi:hypothetical protein